MKKFLISSVAAFLLFSPLLVSAFETDSNGNIIPDQQTQYNSSINQQTQYNSSGGQAPNGGSGFSLHNPLSVSSICGLIKKVLNAILALGIPVAMLFLVYAGFKFVLARGNPPKITDARRNLLHVVMGIGIFLGAWLLGQIIANTINAINPGTISGTNSCS